MAQNSNGNYFDAGLYKFGELKMREVNLRKPRLAIQSQTSTPIKIEPKQVKTSKKEEKYEQMDEKVNVSKQLGSSNSRISKGVLRECQLSICWCLNELIESLSALFRQLLQLNIEAPNHTRLRVIYQRTIQQAHTLINQMPQQQGQINANYNQLLSATQKIATYIAIFRKQLNLRAMPYELPPKSQIFSYLLSD